MNKTGEEHSLLLTVPGIWHQPRLGQSGGFQCEDNPCIPRATQLTSVTRKAEDREGSYSDLSLLTQDSSLGTGVTSDKGVFPLQQTHLRDFLMDSPSGLSPR